MSNEEGAPAGRVEQQIIAQVSDSIVAKFEEQLRNDPQAGAKIGRARDEFRQVGMYRMMVLESAKSMLAIIRVLEKYERVNDKFDLLVSTLRDWEQKATFAAQTSMNSVSKTTFLDGLAKFQEEYLTPKDGQMVRQWIIDGLWTSDREALIAFLKGKALSEDYLRECMDEIEDEDIAEVFGLLKENTKMIVFPTCYIKKMSAMVPGANNLYDAWLAGLPILMDRIFSSVVNQVGRMANIEANGGPNGPKPSNPPARSDQ